jgi:hypothetical protein
MAMTCTRALVDPPSAINTVMAFSNDPRVRMSRGFRSSHTISTMRLPEAVASRPWLESTAGTAEPPGSVSPRVSVMAVMVDAVPITMQVPGERAMPPSISFQSASVMLPARSSAQYFQASLPLPRVSPRQFPRSIGPAGK